jgi:hypothetical protein
MHNPSSPPGNCSLRRKSAWYAPKLKKRKAFYLDFGERAVCKNFATVLFFFRSFGLGGLVTYTVVNLSFNRKSKKI